MSINSLILEGMWDKKFIETGKKKKKGTIPILRGIPTSMQGYILSVLGEFNFST